MTLNVNEYTLRMWMNIFATKKFLAEREFVYMLIDEVVVECEWMWNLWILHYFANHSNTQEKFENNVFLWGGGGGGGGKQVAL